MNWHHPLPGYFWSHQYFGGGLGGSQWGAGFWGNLEQVGIGVGVGRIDRRA